MQKIEFEGQVINVNGAQDSPTFMLAEIAQILGKTGQFSQELTASGLLKYLEEEGSDRAKNLYSVIQLEMDKYQNPGEQTSMTSALGYDISPHLNHSCIYLIQIDDKIFKFGKTDNVKTRMMAHKSNYKKTDNYVFNIVKIWNCQSREHMDRAEVSLRVHCTSNRLIINRQNTGVETIATDNIDEVITFIEDICSYRWAISNKLINQPFYQNPGNHPNVPFWSQFVPPVYVFQHLPAITAFMRECGNMINAQTEFLRMQNFMNGYRIANERVFVQEVPTILPSPIQQNTIENALPPAPIVEVPELPEIKPAPSEEAPKQPIKPEKVKEKIECECGDVIVKTHLIKHKKSKKHLNFIKQSEGSPVVAAPEMAQI